jgi:ankyrin repeat protein
MVCALADQCAACSQAVLRNAVCCGHENSVKALLQSGVSTEVTYLHEAANNGFKQVVHYLLEYGADVNEADKHGMTALHRATRGGFIGAASVLIDAGAAVDAVEPECGNTPLHFAAKAAAAPLIRLLLAEGAVLKKQNRDGDDAQAVWKGSQLEFNELLADLYSEMHGVN